MAGGRHRPAASGGDAEGGTIGSVAAELGVSRDMVSKWRGRFLRQRLGGLTDEPRPGRPRTVSDEQAELVITATLPNAVSAVFLARPGHAAVLSTGAPRRRALHPQELQELLRRPDHPEVRAEHRPRRLTAWQHDTLRPTLPVNNCHIL
jgi:hypothetical protein